MTFVPSPLWDLVSLSVKWRAIMYASESWLSFHMKHSVQAWCIVGAHEMGHVNSLL